MFVAKECCLTFLANPLGDLERRGIAGTSQPQPIDIVNNEARAGRIQLVMRLRAWHSVSMPTLAKANCSRVRPSALSSHPAAGEALAVSPERPVSAHARGA